IVGGGRGSPRYGCLRSWKCGTSTCANRVTVRAIVVDRVLLEGLRAELVAPATVEVITRELSAALSRLVDARPQRLAEAHAARDQARQRLQRLVAAIEEGVAPRSIAASIAEREVEVARLEAIVQDLAAPIHPRMAVMPSWVRQQLEDLAGLLRESPERTKATFRDFDVRVVMTPQQLSNRQVFYRADVESRLDALTGSRNLGRHGDAAVDRLLP
ncbi:MAG: hypothetical protein ABR606_18770, partial [Vicinamibacterales bacterium]